MEKMNFEILKIAQVRQTELAALAGVTRAAVNAWCNGSGTVHPLRATRVSKSLAAITSAVDEKLLPIEGSHSATKRLAMLREILLTQLKKS